MKKTRNEIKKIGSLRFQNLTYVFTLFSRPEKFKLILITISGIVLSVLDLVGVVLIGLVGSIATLGVTGEEAGGITKLLLNSLMLESFDRVAQISLVGTLAGLFLILKTIISYVIQKRLAFFIEARVTDLISRFLRSTIDWGLSNLNRTPKREMLQSMQNGIPNLISGVTIPSMMLVSDVALILILSSALFFTEPVLAAAITILFLMAAIFLHVRLSIKQRRMGVELSSIMLDSQLNFEVLIEGYREAYVRDVRENFILRVESDRKRASKILAEFAVVSQVGKYAFEVTMVLGAALIVTQQFLVSSTSRAVAVIGLFIAASFRIGPAILRIQHSVLSVRRAIAKSEFTMKILREMRFEDLRIPDISLKPFPVAQDIGGVALEFKDVSFTYENELEELISGFNFVSRGGEHIAIVGKSGVGKTTLVDLLVGALSPSNGSVKLFGLDPKDCIKRYPGTISYLPQEILILNGSIRDNICFGYSTSEVSEEKIWRALSLARLDDWVKSLNQGLEFIVWDKGANISGGQRQRLGLARALLTEPRLLILDEATSALDENTQTEISDSLRNLKGKLTLVMIAHRIKSILHTDRVISISGPNQVAVVETAKFISRQ